MKAAAELLVEPFLEGRLGPHVQSAIDSLESAGFDVTVGPFGNQIAGDHNAVVEAIGQAITSAIEAGAIRISLTLEIDA